MLVAHPSNSSNHYSQFTSLVGESLRHMRTDANARPDYFLSRKPDEFEVDVHTAMEANLGSLPFEIELVSGKKFPDIVAYVNASKAFGVEVKTSKKNDWKAVGGSIMESTRVANVERIHVFYGKLCDPLGFEARPYEDCIDDVRITHSPRYHLDLKLAQGMTFFDELGITYDDLRNNPAPFDPIREHFRTHRAMAGEDVWWLESSTPNLLVRHWSNLSTDEKSQLISVGFAFCPEIFSSSSDKYKKLSVMLAAKYGIVNSSLRDSFSAGGRFDYRGSLIPKVFETYIGHRTEIRRAIQEMSDSDILHYWGRKNVTDKVATWNSLALGHALRSRGVSNVQSVIRTLLS